MIDIRNIELNFMQISLFIPFQQLKAFIQFM